MTTHTNLLIDEEPLQVLPSLACEVGLHEAMVLQQIHYWLHPKRKSGKVVDGTRWIFNSYAQWHEQFPFLTEKVIGNAIRSLERQGYLRSRQDLNAVGSDRRKWYTVDYDRFRDVQRPCRDDDDPSGDDDDTQTGRSSITETTSTETTTESTASAKRKSGGAHDLINAFSDEMGIHHPTNYGKAIGQATQLLRAGATPEMVRACTSWLLGDPFWTQRGIDFGTVLSQWDKFLAWSSKRGSTPVRVKDAKGNYTPDGLRMFAEQLRRNGQ